MIIRLVMVLAVVGLVIFGIGSYLGVDDLSGCDISSPSRTGVCSSADAVVVISGGDTNARTDEAIRLYKSGWAPLIVFSGAAADKDGPSNAEVMHQRAIDNGVPAAAAAIEDQSETTRQNAQQVKERLTNLQAEEVILVTSGYHMRRAGLEFSRELGSVQVRNHPVASDRQWGDFWWLTPWGWLLALSELVKIGAFYVGASR